MQREDIKTFFDISISALVLGVAAVLFMAPIALFFFFILG